MADAGRPLRIGILGPVSLPLLRFDEPVPQLPEGYPAPVIASLVNGLVDRGHEVAVFTTSADLDRSIVLGDGRLTAHVAPRGRARSAATFFARERAALGALIADCELDVLHAQWTYEFAWAAMDAGKPYVVTAHDYPPTVVRFRPDAYRILRAAMALRVFRSAPRLTTVSPYLLDCLPSGVRARTTLIPDFLDAASVGAPVMEPPADPLVVTVSNGFGRLKNVTSALRAFAVLRRSLPEARYRLLGDGLGADGPAARFAADNGLAAGVEFLGPLPQAEAMRHLRAARVVLHPSLEESFGMAVLEAMSAGVPVVGGERSGNVPYLLGGEEPAGLLCDVTDVERTAEALRRIMCDDSLWRLLSAGGSAGARRYSAERALAAYERVYDDLLTPQDWSER